MARVACANYRRTHEGLLVVFGQRDRGLERLGSGVGLAATGGICVAFALAGDLGIE